MAQFLIDASLPRPVADVFRQHGHTATDVRDIGLGTAKDADIAAHAKANQFALVTVDLDFGNILQYPPTDYAGIVVVRPPENATGDVVLSLLEHFLQAADVLANLPGRLAVVEPGRIRLRPAL